MKTARKTADLRRCPWAKNEQYIEYHDKEWGVPVHDDRTLFEFLVLEGAQAGLSWETILKKRESYHHDTRYGPTYRLFQQIQNRSREMGALVLPCGLFRRFWG